MPTLSNEYDEREHASSLRQQREIMAQMDPMEQINSGEILEHESPMIDPEDERVSMKQGNLKFIDSFEGHLVSPDRHFLKNNPNDLITDHENGPSLGCVPTMRLGASPDRKKGHYSKLRDSAVSVEDYVISENELNGIIEYQLTKDVFEDEEDEEPTDWKMNDIEEEDYEAEAGTPGLRTQSRSGLCMTEVQDEDTPFKKMKSGVDERNDTIKKMKQKVVYDS
jgi:hypothetical protein